MIVLWPLRSIGRLWTLCLSSNVPWHLSRANKHIPPHSLRNLHLHFQTQTLITSVKGRVAGSAAQIRAWIPGQPWANAQLASILTVAACAVFTAIEVWLGWFCGCTLQAPLCSSRWRCNLVAGIGDAGGGASPRKPIVLAGVNSIATYVIKKIKQHTRMK